MINETPIGNIQPNTFHPTEAEKLVLMNIADMAEQGRSVTQQDAINVPEEKLQELEIGEDNLESAFAQLVKIKMIETKPDQTLQVSQAGQAVVDELKKAEDQEALTQQSDGGDGTEQANPLDQQLSGPMSQAPTQNSGFGEAFGLIKYMNDMVKIIK